MFGRSKPVVFDPYRRRSGATVPRWLWMLLLGAALGAAGVVYVQHEWLPPRLSAAETARLQQAYRQADADRVRLQAELDLASEGLRQAQGAVARLGADASGASGELATLRGDLALVVDALPPDPRDGAVAVRAGSFSAKAGQLDYSLVLTRDGGDARPLDGVLQIVVSGPAGAAGNDAVALEPVPLKIGRRLIERGRLALPAGAVPRLATIRILDRPDGRQLGMRILRID